MIDRSSLDHSFLWVYVMYLTLETRMLWMSLVATPHGSKIDRQIERQMKYDRLFKVISIQSRVRNLTRGTDTLITRGTTCHQMSDYGPWDRVSRPSSVVPFTKVVHFHSLPMDSREWTWCGKDGRARGITGMNWVKEACKKRVLTPVPSIITRYILDLWTTRMNDPWALSITRIPSYSVNALCLGS